MLVTYEVTIVTFVHIYTDLNRTNLGFHTPILVKSNYVELHISSASFSMSI